MADRKHGGCGVARQLSSLADWLQEAAFSVRKVKWCRNEYHGLLIFHHGCVAEL